jgi:hypothetical protein
MSAETTVLPENAVAPAVRSVYLLNEKDLERRFVATLLSVVIEGGERAKGLVEFLVSPHIGYCFDSGLAVVIDAISTLFLRAEPADLKSIQAMVLTMRGMLGPELGQTPELETLLAMPEAKAPLPERQRMLMAHAEALEEMSARRRMAIIGLSLAQGALDLVSDLDLLMRESTAKLSTMAAAFDKRRASIFGPPAAKEKLEITSLGSGSEGAP